MNGATKTKIARVRNDGRWHSRGSDWSTPQELFDKLNAEFSFTLDVCAIPENAKCKNYFTPEIDGLSQRWEGICWLNPPYGREIGKWVKKAYFESRSADCIVVGLLPARTDTKWFHDYIYQKADIEFVKGRLKFGDAKNSAPFPSMIVVWK
jgi:phage N-6-adenine-methyltransferase